MEPFAMTSNQTLKCPTCSGFGVNYVTSDIIPAMQIPESHTEACPICKGTGGIEREPMTTVDVQVFQYSGGQIMGVFRLRDPRPHKENLYSAAMPIDEALGHARYFARTKSAELVIDDPLGRLRGHA
jgi:hypothetical protein